MLSTIDEGNKKKILFTSGKYYINIAPLAGEVELEMKGNVRGLPLESESYFNARHRRSNEAGLRGVLCVSGMYIKF